jgi:hypothetical protein
MADLYQEITEFSGGVQSSAAADRIPLNATPLAINTAFRNIGSKQANLGTRPGLVTINSTAIAGSPAIQFQRLYAYDAGSSFYNYLALVTNTGRLYFKDTSDTLTSELTPPADFRGTASHLFATGDSLIDGTVMNNRLFLVDQNSELRSLLNQTYKPWGLSPLATWTAAGAASGINAMPNETYDVSITTYDSATGAESAIATYTSVAIGGANRRLKIDITPTSTESATYSHWRVYVRRQTTQADLYKVSNLYNAAGTLTITDSNIPIATTTIYADLSSAQIAALTTVAPSAAQYGLPPTDIRYVCTYGRRLICASDRNVYWSLIDKPDSFPTTAFEPIETGEGDRITGVYPFSSELCVVTTTTSTWGIFGSDPETWVIRPIDHSVGSVSHLSITEYDGKLAWWSSERGPVFFDGEKLSFQALDDLGVQAVVGDIEPSSMSKIYGGYDPQGQRILWSVAPVGTLTRLTRLIPYNTRIQRFEASYWNPMDVSSMSMGYLADGTQRLFVGGFGGQLFYFDKDTMNDGVVSGTSTQTFTPSTSTITTIDGTGFDTTGAGLAERYVVVCDSDNRPMGKSRISSNTSTVLTLANGISGLTAGRSHTAYIGGPDMRLYTKWLDLEQTFNRKRFDRLYLQAQSSGDVSAAYVATQVDFINETLAPQNPFQVSGASWDSAVWDTSQWAGVGQLKKRIFIGRTGQSLRVSMFHFKPDVDLTVHTIGVLARQQSERYYGD